MEKQHAGLPEPDAKPSAASIRPPGERGAEGLCPSVASSLPDTYAAPGPGSATGKILIPGDGAAGDQGLRIGLRARQ